MYMQLPARDHTAAYQVSLLTTRATDTSWYAAVLSATGTCYYLRDSIAPATNPGTMYSTGAKADCTATKAAVTTSGPVYVDKW